MAFNQTRSGGLYPPIGGSGWNSLGRGKRREIGKPPVFLSLFSSHGYSPLAVAGMGRQLTVSFSVPQQRPSVSKNLRPSFVS